MLSNCLNVFLASFRERCLGLCPTFLSKCCFFVILFVSGASIFGQNVITVKKETEEKVISFKGFYFSDYFTMESGSPGEPPTDYRRMYLYVDEYMNAYIFHSNKDVKKIYAKFVKNPTKYAEEYGTLEISQSVIYLKTTSSFSQTQVFRYVGEVLTENTFYMEYKAVMHSKIGLYIYLHKYVK